MPSKTKTARPKAMRPAGVEPFVITRVFDAPRDLVVRAWTEREHLMHWWGPKGVTRLPGKLDLRPGGIFHYALKLPDGLLWGKWEIREVALPDRLVWVNAFSDEAGGTTGHPAAPDWPRNILTTVTFTDEPGGKTKVTVLWEPIDPTPEEAAAFNSMRPNMQQGWGGSFEDLAAHLPEMSRARAQKVTPYLTLSNATAAIDWYKTVFGAKERMRKPAEDGKRVMHCDLAINGGTVLLSDEFSEHGSPAAPNKDSKPPVAICLDFAAPSEIDSTYRRAVEAGATGIMEPADQFWGARFAMLTDPFGHRWMLSAQESQS